MLMKIGNEHQVSAFIFLVHFTPGNLRANNTLIVSRKFGGIQLVRHIRYVFILLIYTAYCVMVTSIRVGWGPQTFFSMHGNQLPSLSGVHVLEVFLWCAQLLESFHGRSSSLKHFHKCKFFHKGLKKMSATEKILQTMNSWQWGELIAVCRKKCLGASSRPNVHDIPIYFFHNWNKSRK